MGPVRFVITTSARYSGITPKDKDTLYFISDERRIYKGEVPYSGGIFTTVAEFPETGEVNTLYVNSATGEVRYYNGTSYQTVVPATGKSITGKGDGSLATTAAVAAYVTSQTSSIQTQLNGFDGRITANATAIANEVTRAKGAEQTNATAIATNESDIKVITESGGMGRGLIVMGDSFSGGLHPVEDGYESSNYGWLNWLAADRDNRLPKGYDFLELGLSAIGVGTKGFTSSDPWINNLNAAYSNLSGDKRNYQVADIYVIGGTNDYKSSADVIDAAIKEFIDTAKSYFPNAKVHIGILSTQYDLLATVRISYMLACAKYGATYISATYPILNDRFYLSSDNVHLTEEGYEHFLPAIYSAIFENSTYTRPFLQDANLITVEPADGFTMTAPLYIYEWGGNDAVYANLWSFNNGPSVFHATDPTSFNASWKKFYDISGNKIISGNHMYGQLFAAIRMNNNTLYYVPQMFDIMNGIMVSVPTVPNSGIITAAEITNLDYVIFPQSHVDMLSIVKKPE